MTARGRYDVAVVGGGPVGAACAIAHAHQGLRVALLEATPGAARRFAGEWLHPPAVEVLGRLGVGHPVLEDHRAGEGFVVFPEDGSEPIPLSYAAGRGATCEHGDLVSVLRQAATGLDGVHYLPGARVVAAQPGRVEYTLGGGARTLHCDLVVGADGRSSVVRAALGLPNHRAACSRMAGVLLRGVELPFEGLGHVLLGGPGPALAYRIGPDAVRLCLDVPLSIPVREAVGVLWSGYEPVLPPPLRRAFREALGAGRVAWAANQVRPRLAYGRRGMVIVGDAVGHYHPLTAAGMTFGFGDAETLAQRRTFEAWWLSRRRATRIPEMLAVALYEVFADEADDATAVRRAVYEMWRRHPEERTRTMGLLAGQDARPSSFGPAFVEALSAAARQQLGHAAATGQVRRAARTMLDLGRRARWMAAGFAHLRPPADPRTGRSGAGAYGPALRVSVPRAEVVRLPAPSWGNAGALAHAVDALLGGRRSDGAFEGEVVWCEMLAAQYVLACRVLGEAVPAARRQRILLALRRARRADGCWGLHPAADEASLFVTTLVYVAARLLGEPPDAPWLADAHPLFAEGEGVVAIPAWGRTWLALLGLYGWEGVPPVLPEAWAQPERSPAHPSRLYCHTRLIYLAMGLVWAHRRAVAPDDTLRALREELFPGGFARVDFRRGRGRVRGGDVVAPPGRLLGAAYAGMRAFEPLRSRGLRGRLVTEGLERVRWELASTSGACISPVSGLLNAVALQLAGEAAEARAALLGLERWVWEDDERGTRIAGARSAAWDTSFAIRALVAAGVDASEPARWLAAQQITEAPAGWRENDRVDPVGGWCFGDAWHGWPVSDCTAEAVGALLDADAIHDRALARAISFILRCRNPDGGFGSYEPRRTRLPLDLLPLPRQLVQRHPVLLDGAVHRRDLRDVTDEVLQRRRHGLAVG